MRIFYKNNGTISVFLSLILLPVMLMGCLTVDASRIYLSKVVISDAGEMAMNAGLAQYNEELHDEYGLLTMDKTPEAMSDELEKYFCASLNGTGIAGAEDYERILDLLKEDFEAVSVVGSEICRTEVEKQQIIEYMKYRAPVCLTELVLEKFKELQDTKVMAEAMEAQLEFTDAMQDCYDEFKKAVEALEVLDRAVEDFPSDETIRTELANTEADYKGVISRCLLMREVIQRYDRREQSNDLKAMGEAFIASAKKVDLSQPDSLTTFNSYIDALRYMNTVSHLGGINKLLQDYDSQSAQDSEEENSNSTDQEREELEKITDNYNAQKSRIEGYINTLLEKAKGQVEGHYATLNGYRSQAAAAASAATTAYDRLEDVKKKLDAAEDKFNTWDSKNSILKETGKSGAMDSEVEAYRTFFSSGEGHSDMQDLESLMAAVASNEGFFKDIQDILQNEKFFGKSVASASVTDQLEKYMSEAGRAADGNSADYSSVENIRGRFAQNYDHVEISSEHSKRSISNDPFYKRLQDYCEEQNHSGSQKEQDEANGNLEKSKNAGGEADSIGDYPEFDWGSAGALPSSETGAHERHADESLTDLDTDNNVMSSSARKGTVSKFKESIHQAGKFLDGVDRIVANGLENLYIAEYAMQMFSYYTVDKADGQTRPEQEIISLSGYPFGDREAYKGECEYILWGNSTSLKNVQNTLMLIFGVRLLFNSFYAFTDAGINATATAAATAMAGAAAPYLIPIIKAVIKLGYAGVETADDITKIKQGYGVTIFKTSSSWKTGGGDNTTGVTFDYSEYLRIFLNVYILSESNEESVLGRIADCIQVDKKDIDLFNSYTMLAVEAKVRVRTTFMRRISELAEAGVWGYSDDTYPVTYQSILGY